MPSLLISTTTIELIPRSRLRRSFIVQNEDAAIAAFLKRERAPGLTTSSTDHDHRLGPGGSLAINSDTDGREAIQDRWTITAASGTPRISWFETEDIIR